VIVLSSVTSEKAEDWIFRIFDRRNITVKAKNDEVKKIAVIDDETNVPFAVEAENAELMDAIKVGQSYYAAMKVLTARNVTGVAPEAVDFFTVLDVDQPIVDFIKAYWLYPKLIRFVLTEIESS
jgi:hypothetical protein